MASVRVVSGEEPVAREPGGFVKDVLLPSLALSLVLFGLMVVLLGGEELVGYSALAVGGLCVLLVFDYYLWQKGRFGSLCLALFLLFVILVLSLGIRLLLFRYENVDLHLISAWYSRIESQGGFLALRGDFSDYPPLFLYVLTALTYIPLKSLYGIKLFSVVFDYMAGWWAYRLVRLKYPSGLLPVAAFFAVVLAPTVVVNGSLWGQSDVIYTSFLLASLYFMVRLSRDDGGSHNRRDVYLALVAFGVAFSFKPHSVFFILPLVFLYLSRKARWYQFLIIPFVFFLTVVPNYYIGKPLSKLLLFYPDQIDRMSQLSITAPSVYQLLPYNSQGTFLYLASLLFCVALVLFFSLLLLYKRVTFSQHNVIKVAMVSLLVVPYFLPGMRERYFFPADVMAIIFAFYFPRFWYLPLVVGGTSLLSYAGFLTDQEVFDYKILALVMGVAVIIVVRNFLLREDSRGKFG